MEFKMLIISGLFNNSIFNNSIFNNSVFLLTSENQIYLTSPPDQTTIANPYEKPPSSPPFFILKKYAYV